MRWLDPGISFSDSSFQTNGGTDIVIWLLTQDGSAKYGLADDNFEMIIPPVFDWIGPFSEGMAPAVLDGKSIFIDNAGNEVLDVSKYDSAMGFWNGFSVVNLDSKAGLIDTAGNVILPLEYSFASAWDGVLWAGSIAGNRQFLFDLSGEKLLEMEDIQGLAGENVIVGEGGKSGVVNLSGEIIIPIEYENIWALPEEIFIVTKDAKSALMDFDGEYITEYLFDHISGFSEEGLASVMIDGKFGVIDTGGEIVIPVEFDIAPGFFSGSANVAVRKNDTLYHRLINPDGETIIGPKEYAMRASNGGFIGHFNPYAGTDIVPPRNYSIREALLDKNGNRLTGFSYRHISDFNAGLAIAAGTAGRFPASGIINQHGTKVVPLIFDQIEFFDDFTYFVRVAEVLEGTIGQNGRIGILTLPPDAADILPDFPRPITVYLDGFDLFFDVEPIIVNGRTMVPMRKIFEILGAEVSWDESERKVTAVRGDIMVELRIGNNNAIINGETVTLDVAAIIKDDRTLVPLRVVAEALECEVDWDNANRRVIIKTQ